MRTLKKSGIILLVAILTFITLGLFLNKQEYQLETTINRPLAEVFQLFNDHNRLSEWLTEVQSFEPITETENRIGSRYKMMVDNDGKIVELIETLTDYKENEMVETEFVAGWMHKYNHFTFSESENGTKIIAHYSIEGTNPFAKSLFLFFTKSFQEVDGTNLARFTTFAEKQAIFIEPINEIDIVN
ncbi:SRPBCC family protein [Labilibaculum antarcticum]|uniref:1,4-dihydroxy-2-naphthoate prenyltransferase n=1 Tax=Labilibaculum antarcticum TaxID=1717717 RepID=A0A1Y1CMI0_9BACT|nr:SRPBCC family protein [Labilibaculum antarcticum]BAX81500.1 1,4-dihydroxy-2-naphthoate prenyltransferase [Labilibaculum antarcticum]